MTLFGKRRLAAIVLAVGTAWLALAELGAAQQCEPAGPQDYPGQQWRALDVRSAGWSEAGLARAMVMAERGHYASGMVVYRGHVLASFGDVARPQQVRSIRKSLLNAVLGQLVSQGRIDLGAKSGQLRIDEKTPLTPQERSATVRDLLMSRSGIYLPAAYEDPGAARERPARGSHAPGTYFWYNNWDFNVLGTIAARAGGRGIFEQLEASVARPLEMQDFSLANTELRLELVSQHPAYLFEMSTRDRARFGLLYLRGGCWQGNQIVPADWVRDTLSPLTDREGEMDYGYLWWSQDGLESVGMHQRMYMARGSANQYISLIPEADVVLVLTTDMGLPAWLAWLRPRPEFGTYVAVLKEVLRARPGQR